MVNGTHGDHPLTDILHHHLRVYGEQEDELIRKIAKLSSMTELDEWWQKEIGWTPDQSTILGKAKARHEELLKQAKDRGWETTRGISERYG